MLFLGEDGIIGLETILLQKLVISGNIDQS